MQEGTAEDVAVLDLGAFDGRDLTAAADGSAAPTPGNARPYGRPWKKITKAGGAVGSRSSWAALDEEATEDAVIFGGLSGDDILREQKHAVAMLPTRPKSRRRFGIRLVDASVAAEFIAMATRAQERAANELKLPAERQAEAAAAKAGGVLGTASGRKRTALQRALGERLGSFVGAHVLEADETEDAGGSP